MGGAVRSGERAAAEVLSELEGFLDDGEVISGSGTIARWAKEHPSSPAKSAG